MNIFIHFVLSVKDSVHPHSLREERKITVVALSSTSAKNTYYTITKHHQVQVLGIDSAELIDEEACNALFKDKTVLFGEETLRIIELSNKLTELKNHVLHTQRTHREEIHPG